MPHIAVVEDDHANAYYIGSALRRAGYEVTVTEDVDKLLALASGGKVDLVVMDVSLKHSTYAGKPITGDEIARLLKDGPETAKIPILLATAHAMTGDRERLLAASKADLYLSKPMHLHTLLATVSHLLRT